MKTTKLMLAAFVWLLASSSHAAHQVAIDRLTGRDVLTGELVKVDASKKKGVVTVFLSAICPCSNSHAKELTELAKLHPDFAFVGIHSNVDEGAETTKNYFRAAALPFPVIQDEKTKLADLYEASKTPHVFVSDAGGKILYRGGVSDSNRIENSQRRFLREALADLAAGRAVKTSQGRALGCAITRGD